MGNFLLIAACFTAGNACKRFQLLPENAATTLNRFILYFSLPALTLSLLHKLNFSRDAIYPIAMPWIFFLLGLGFFLFLGRNKSKQTLGTLILTGSLGNTSFVGFPLLEALYGSTALATGILVDQPGSFLVAGTLGIFIASIFSGRKTSPQLVFKKVFSFPPFLAVLASVVLRPLLFPEALEFVLHRIGDTLIPLALFSVGLQLRLDKAALKRERNNLLLGLGFKLFLGPLFFIFIYGVILHLHGDLLKIIITESAMAPMITAGIIASEYGLDAELANLMIGFGTPLSLLSVPLWAWVLNLGFLIVNLPKF